MADIFSGYTKEQIREALPHLTFRERAEFDAIIAKSPAEKNDVLVDAFPEQVAYVLDPAPFKFLFCTRRAAKSFSFGLDCFHDGANWPKGNYLFLGLVREEAKRIFWKDVLKEINEKFKLGAEFNESSLTCTLANGATIYIGAADANDQEWRKLLGQKYRRVFIDEAQDWKLDLRELVYSTLAPALADHKGSVTLAGTPGRARAGLFHDLTCNSVAGSLRPGKQVGWSGHSWTTSANTAMMPADPGEPGSVPERMCDRWNRNIEALKASHPGIEDTPAFRRNFKGEWVVDDDSAVYKYVAGKNGWNGNLPFFDRGSWHTVLGVDLGYVDDTSFTRMKYHDFSPNLYITKSEKKKGMDISAVAFRIKAIQKEEGNVEMVVIDGSNKQAVMEMQNRHGLSLYTADKTGKPDFIELMNADFITGRILVDEVLCEPLVDEWSGLVWNDKTTKREEHPACPNHCCDSALYGWRYCYQYVSKVLPKVPADHAEHMVAEAALMFERTRAQVEREKEQHIGSFGEVMGEANAEMEWGV
jgi:hypothetical protein